MQEVVGSAEPVCLNDPPRSIRNDLPDTNALVSQRPRKLIVIGYHDSTTPRLRRWLRLRSPYGWRGRGLLE